VLISIKGARRGGQTTFKTRRQGSGAEEDAKLVSSKGMLSAASPENGMLDQTPATGYKEGKNEVCGDDEDWCGSGFGAPETSREVMCASSHVRVALLVPHLRGCRVCWGHGSNRNQVVERGGWLRGRWAPTNQGHGQTLQFFNIFFTFSDRWTLAGCRIVISWARNRATRATRATVNAPGLLAE
jgi:hypothetical protein